MERINQYAYYELGSALGRMQNISGDTVPSNAVFEVWAAQREINGLLENVKVPLGVSRQNAHAVKVLLDEIDREYFHVEGPEGEWIKRVPRRDAAPIPSWRLFRVKTAIEAFQTVFKAEMSEAASYFVPRRGIFYTPVLIDRADESFPEGLRANLPEKARVDWRSAGRCLAFSLFSASGFHVARAVEATLEVYYQLYTGKVGTLHGWQNYIDALEVVLKSNASPKPVPKTLAELVQMKDDYRNPVMHPRVSLSEADARMLFDNGESVIIAMIEEIKAIKDAGGLQAGLSLLGGGQVTP